MALTDIALASAALIRLGAEPISAFDEGTTEADVAVGVYATERDALLAAHPWGFATAQAPLALLGASPEADFLYAYQLPGQFLRGISLGRRIEGGGVSGASPAATGRGARYRILEQRVHTNAEQAVMTYIFRPDESAFPAWFDSALIDRLAAAMALSLTDSMSRADAMHGLAERSFRTAKTIDGQGQTAPEIADWPLIDCRG